MAVFVTFSDSMQSLFLSKARTNSCEQVKQKQKELTSRYQFLKTHADLLFDRLVSLSLGIIYCASQNHFPPTRLYEIYCPNDASE